MRTYLVRILKIFCPLAYRTVPYLTERTKIIIIGCHVRYVQGTEPLQDDIQLNIEKVLKHQSK